MHMSHVVIIENHKSDGNRHIGKVGCHFNKSIRKCFPSETIHKPRKQGRRVVSVMRRILRNVQDKAERSVSL